MVNNKKKRYGKKPKYLSWKVAKNKTVIVTFPIHEEFLTAGFICSKKHWNGFESSWQMLQSLLKL